MNEEQHVLDWLPAYGLGVLDGEEFLLVKKHLEHCTVCGAELAAYREAIDQIPLSVPIYKPPSRVKQATLKRIAPTRTDRSNWLARIRNGFHNPVPVWALVGFSIIIIILLGGGAALWAKNQQLAQAQHDRFAVVELSGSASSPSAYGWIVVSQDGQSGTLIVQDLPSLASNTEYQLWLYKGEQTTSGGVFKVDRNGYASIWVASALPLVDYQRFSITIEPNKGSPTPTGQVIISGKF